jgi:ribosomal protein S21
MSKSALLLIRQERLCHSIVSRFHRHRISRTRCISMGARVEVRQGESLFQALKRLKKLVWQQRRFRTWGAEFFVPRTEARRKKKWRKQVLASRETMLAKLKGLQ